MLAVSMTQYFSCGLQRMKEAFPISNKQDNFLREIIFHVLDCFATHAHGEKSKIYIVSVCLIPRDVHINVCGVLGFNRIELRKVIRMRVLLLNTYSGYI